MVRKRKWKIGAQEEVEDWCAEEVEDWCAEEVEDWCAEEAA